MKIFKYILTLILFLQFVEVESMDQGDKRKAVEVANSIVDKIIRESAFDFKYVLQKEALNMQIIDFENEYGSTEGVFYAISNMVSSVDTTLRFGLSYSGGIKIWLNDKVVYDKINKMEAELKEIAYSMFKFNDSLETELVKGENKILIKVAAGIQKPVVYLREIPETAETPLTCSFKNIDSNTKFENKKWLVAGPFTKDESIKSSLHKNYPPELSMHDYYKTGDQIITWNIQKENLLRELVIKESNSYKRESYLEWHYANGATMFSILSVADKTHNKSYYKYVKNFCDLIISNYDYFKFQYEQLNALRGTNHRIFRKTMLDDTSGPALPFVQLYLKDKIEEYKSIVYEMADYLENEQVRLDDGTLCRPEPVDMTVWADDLFMGIPFMLRMAKITGQNKYYDDAAFQVVKFNELLFDPSLGLYKHGWFEKKNEKSTAYWGRANGWIIWGTTEALLHLPKDHKLYSKILSNYKIHVEGLIKQQSESGMWHQVLNEHESFKETSCSAMFVMGILRGVKNGWLDSSYKDYALRAWQEIKTNILEDGTVVDICRGTGIGNDLEFYFNRDRFDNDPRGLGAVLNAALEVSEYE